MERDSHMSDKSVLADGTVRTKDPKEGTGLACQGSEAELGALRLGIREPGELSEP